MKKVTPTTYKTDAKKDDLVIMLAGKDKGKKGKVLKIDRRSGRALIDGLNLIKKHQRPRKQGEKGEIISLPGSVDFSNFSLFCQSCNKGVRTGYRLEGDEKIRICKKCQSAI